MRRSFPLLVALALAAVATAGSAQELQPVDRVVAVVDEDPILASEVEQLIGLRLVETVEDEEPEALRRRALDRLIEQKLRFHEIDRYGFVELPVDEVDAQYQVLASRLGDLDARLEALGMTAENLRHLVARQLMVLTYVEERLGARVFVDLEDIRAYYDGVLAPEMRAAGRPPPPLQQVREQIREVLREQRLNEEIDDWTEELRLQADVVDYFDAEAGELPPVAAVRESEEP